MTEKKVWFITGSSTGFGRELAEELLEQGHNVVATARKPEVLADLVGKYPETAKAVKLDITKPDEVRAAINEAAQSFGRIDVVVNNAGYASIGAIEEFTDAQIRRQFETNFFGAIDVTRAALPILREQKSGYIVNISSLSGFVGFSSLGFYSASKFALEAVSEALVGELAPHNIKVLIVEPGLFRTAINAGALDTAENLKPSDYPETTKWIEWAKENQATQPGDPRKAAKAIIKAVESPNAPLRLVLGEDAISTIESELEKVKADIAPWRQIGIETALDQIEV